ncbi:MAG: Crp/Fnr family transcriptional regulator [Rubripirellula sp.]|nr:Crp/Fnr family transcriptional regulator [Rubripirellula sp.]
MSADLTDFAAGIDLLRQMDLTAGLSGPELSELAKIARHTDLPPASVVFREGQNQSVIYWVVDGAITLETTGARLKPIVLLTVGPGEVLGWSALVGDSRMTARASTVTNTRLIGFPADDLKKLCDKNHELGYRVMNSIAENLSRRFHATRQFLVGAIE